MKAARLHGPKDMRVEDVPEPPSPQPGDVLIRVKAVGICGSDLHMYEDGRIGDTEYEKPLTLGHEFMGEITAVGEGALDGNFQPLKVGQRVAVDPATPCYHCEMCEAGHPNLCPNHTFYGVYPDDGALQECMIVHGRNCFPMPDNVSDGAGTLLETLGVAIHASDLAKFRVADSVAIIGCGPVGLLILALAKHAGAYPIYAFDKFDWRVEKARQWGATEAWNVDEVDPVKVLNEASHGRGVDIAIEAAWADHSIQMAADMARPGGRLVLVGIPGDDQLHMKHATARRKGLTIRMARRMKLTYPRAYKVVESGMIDLDDLISHHYPLEEAPKAFEDNDHYIEGAHKIIIDI
ncbi:alcohol dehydrogenase catalytic domain-containing protein [Phototrophicus methaneseepsis]|uniref:Alcohol dehydrogenase catalytic domain-containing protein n=1 Tax=Phototrophicus methaneseepsis TaxID=2710758 RepID=A0A7S8IEV8_9CHLR|nr:alcohol dehydrogenase catalytic domain-containing protein [Phototrophicus methaneseepsis]QPC82962.1 alcohol dehydrogenase catalytic domain-containing protein [Phototrophicus methaneseepsis]